MRRFPEMIVSVPEHSLGLRYVRDFPIVTSELAVSLASQAFEISRSLAVNTNNFKNIWGTRKPLLEPETHPMLFSFLQNQGDLMVGTASSFLLNLGISSVDTIQSVYTKKSLHPNLRLAISCGLSTAVITLAESGYIDLAQSADTMDIPSGIIGVGLYAGVNLLARAKRSAIVERIPSLNLSNSRNSLGRLLDKI